VPVRNARTLDADKNIERDDPERIYLEQGLFLRKLANNEDEIEGNTTSRRKSE